MSTDLDEAQPVSGEGELARGLALDVQDDPPVLEEDTVTPPETGSLV